MSGSVGTERSIAWTSRVCYTRANGILMCIGAGKNSESLSIYFLYSEILVIFYCDSSEFSQIHTGEAGTLRSVAPPRRDLVILLLYSTIFR
jgi:hypothetical protein